MFKLAPETKRFLKEFVFPAVIILYIIPGFIGRMTVVPSGSMKPTLLEGDLVIISKLHYGPRTPSTVLQSPIFEKIYIRFPQVPSFHLPGFSSLKLGDAVVFHTPTEIDHPRDQRAYFVKRCMGQPGDKIAMIKGKVYINGAKAKLGEKVRIQRRYKVYLTFFSFVGQGIKYLKKKGIRTIHRLMEGSDDVEVYMVFLTEAEAEKLRKDKKVKAVNLSLEETDYGAPPYFDYDRKGPSFKALKDNFFFKALGGNSDNFPEVQIPFQGWKMKVNADTLKVYGYLIRYHEGFAESQVVINKKENTLTIKGKKISVYQFKKNYYFMIGDNRGNSSDSRFWGFVPEDHIVAKPLIIFGSKKHPKWWTLFSLLTLQMRWKRTFKRIY